MNIQITNFFVSLNEQKYHLDKITSNFELYNEKLNCFVEIIQNNFKETCEIGENLRQLQKNCELKINDLKNLIEAEVILHRKKDVILKRLEEIEAEIANLGLNLKINEHIQLNTSPITEKTDNIDINISKINEHFLTFSNNFYSKCQILESQETTFHQDSIIQRNNFGSENVNNNKLREIMKFLQYYEELFKTICYIQSYINTEASLIPKN